MTNENLQMEQNFPSGTPFSAKLSISITIRAVARGGEVGGEVVQGAFHVANRFLNFEVAWIGAGVSVLDEK